MTKVEKQAIKQLFRAIAYSVGDRAGCNDWDTATARKWNKQFFSVIKDDKEYQNWLKKSLTK